MNLENFRKDINRIDEELLNLIKERSDVAFKVGEFKKKSGLPIINERRESEIYTKIMAMAKEKDIDPEIIKDIWQKLIKISRSQQK